MSEISRAPEMTLGVDYYFCLAKPAVLRITTLRGPSACLTWTKSVLTFIVKIDELFSPHYINLKQISCEGNGSR